jgi:hypothetical protein
MIYDDDTRMHVHFAIDSADEPPPADARIPSPRVQRRIRELARRPGYGPHRIEAVLRHEHHKRRRRNRAIPLSSVKLVLALAAASRADRLASQRNLGEVPK